MGCVCYCSRKGKTGRRYPDPQPFPCVKGSLGAPGALQPGLAQQGWAGAGEVAFNSISAWENSLSCGCL